MYHSRILAVEDDDGEQDEAKAALAEDEKEDEDGKEGEKVDEKEDEQVDETEEVSVEAPVAVVEVAIPTQPPAPGIEVSVLEAPAVEAPLAGAPVDAGGGATYTLEQLTGGCPDGVNPEEKELYLSDAEFKAVFKVDKATFEKLPKWKRVQVRCRD
jgi:hypothetical protein